MQHNEQTAAQLRAELHALQQRNAELEAVAARFRVLAEHSTDFISCHAPNGAYVYASPACRWLLGYEPEELLGRAAYDFFHPDDLTAIAASHARILEQAGIATVNYRIRRRDGTYRWFETTSRAIRDETTAAIIEIQAASRDITERKQAEQELSAYHDHLEELVQQRVAELAAERHLLRVLIDNMPDLILVKDTASRFLALNPALAHLMGAKTPDDLLGKTDFDFYPQEIAQQYYDLEQAILKSGRPLLNQEELHTDPDTGAERWFLATKIPFRDQEGVIRGLVGISRDITEHKQLEEQLCERTAKLEAANKELQSFAYIVSHDLKAPLRAIAKLAQWLVEDYASAFDAKGREMVTLLVGRVQRMDALIDGVLEYSRIGRIVRQHEPIDLNRLLPDVLDSLAPPPTIRIEVAPQLPTIMGDKTRIQQVFQNLIGNAIKFMDKPHGEIAVNCVDDGAFWRFSVTDNGPGIDPKYHEKIFQIFQTLHPRDELESTGVGLAIVKKIVEFYGGKAGVESDTGQGGTFWFTLPKHQTP